MADKEINMQCLHCCQTMPSGYTSTCGNSYCQEIDHLQAKLFRTTNAKARHALSVKIAKLQAARDKQRGLGRHTNG